MIPKNVRLTFIFGAAVVLAISMAFSASVGDIIDRSRNLPAKVQTNVPLSAVADGDALAAHVRYSSDGGDTWQSLGVNVSDYKFEVDVSGLPRGQESLVQVVVPMG